jgi:hypothetical protein
MTSTGLGAHHSQGLAEDGAVGHKRDDVRVDLWCVNGEDGAGEQIDMPAR